MLTSVAMATNLTLVSEWARREGVAADPWHKQPSEAFGSEELGPDVKIVLSPATLDLDSPDEIASNFTDTLDGTTPFP